MTSATPTAEAHGELTLKDIADELSSDYRLFMDDADFIDVDKPAMAISIRAGCESLKKCIDFLESKSGSAPSASTLAGDILRPARMEINLHLKYAHDIGIPEEHLSKALDYITKAIESLESQAATGSKRGGRTWNE